jgi:phage regulator Rha-like protein
MATKDKDIEMQNIINDLEYHHNELNRYKFMILKLCKLNTKKILSYMNNIVKKHNEIKKKLLKLKNDYVSNDPKLKILLENLYNSENELCENDIKCIYGIKKELNI